MSLRLVTVPDTAPPYDCETHGAGCPAMRTAAASRQDVTRDPGPRLAPAAERGSRSVPAAERGSSSAPDSVPSTRSALDGAAAGPAGALPWQFAQLIVEIMAGLRSPKQIVGLTTDHAREQARRLAPLLASDWRPKIRRIATSRPAARAVEMTVIVNVGPRSRALAMRLEHLAGRPATPGRPARPDRWLCTAIEAG
jgi:Family of unknown function (DUF6459)